MPDMEPLLKEHLRPVHAPDELWDRIHNPSVPARRQWTWAVAAAALMVVLAWGAKVQSDNVVQVRASNPIQKASADCYLCHSL
jgi:hypothetical protein